MAGKYHYQRSEVEETVSKWIVTCYFFTQRQKPLEAGMCDRNSNSFSSVPHLFLIRGKKEKKKRKTIKINLTSTSFWYGKKKKIGKSSPFPFQS